MCCILDGEAYASTAFFDDLARTGTTFTRAYATECWTLPAHMSIFTGQLPSEHGAHFRHLAYDGDSPTIAEIARHRGYRTELVTRNSIFDGSLPGVTRGFERSVCPLAQPGAGNPMGLLLALSKPRFRRQVLTTGFFHPQQRSNREFVWRFARATLPADERALAYVLDRMEHYRRSGEPYFIFSNLYDVHAPYPPSRSSIFRHWPPSAWLENLVMPFVLPKLGAHRYIREGFRLSDFSRQALLARYRRAIELMDEKLFSFLASAQSARLLDDTVLIITSDHGEGFGEHGLYLHDASVYETHLRVPLWILWPGRGHAIVDDVVSTKDLFGLVRAIVTRSSVDDTILGASYRARHPTAEAEHFHYAGYDDILPKYRRDLRAIIGRRRKIVTSSQSFAVVYDLDDDPEEEYPNEMHDGGVGAASMVL
jgi:arylsulfatase A-like enzyme